MDRILPKVTGNSFPGLGELYPGKILPNTMFLKIFMASSEKQVMQTSIMQTLKQTIEYPCGCDQLAQNVPLVFKYTTADGALRCLANGSLLCRPPHEFNDPLDFAPRFEVPDDNTILEADKARLDRLNKITDYFGGWKYPHTPDSRLELARSMFQYNRRTTMSNFVRMVCLSRCGCHSPMWAYYANNHKGAVLVFDREKLCKPPFTMRDVNYSNTPAMVSNKEFEDCLSGTGDLHGSFFQKQKVWIHEQETRVLAHIPAECPSAMPMKWGDSKALVGIIIHRMDDGDKDALLALLEMPALKHAKVWVMSWYDHGPVFTEWTMTRLNSRN